MNACERQYTGCDVDVDYWPGTTRPENLNQVRRVLAATGYTAPMAQRQEARLTFDLLVKERDEARQRMAEQYEMAIQAAEAAVKAEDERDEARQAHRRVVANESNHYDRYWTPATDPLTDEWLGATEAKMREALTDVFCDDAAAVMLTLIAEIRRLEQLVAPTQVRACPRGADR